jgi:hypothetical protein
MGLPNVFLTQKSAIFHRGDAKNAEEKRGESLKPLRTLRLCGKKKVSGKNFWQIVSND